MPSTAPATPTTSIPPFPLEQDVAQEILGKNPLLSDGVGEVFGVPLMIEKGEVAPIVYQGRMLGLATQGFYLIADKLVPVARAILKRQAEMGMPVMKPENIIGVPMEEGESLERALARNESLVVEIKRRWSVEGNIDPSGWYPYCGNAVADEVARVLEQPAMIQGEAAKLGNSKELLAELHDHPALSDIIPLTRVARSAEEASALYAQHFSNLADAKVIVKPLFGASGTGMETAVGQEEFDAIYERRPKGNPMRDVFDEKENGFVIQSFVGTPEGGTKTSPSLPLWIGEKKGDYRSISKGGTEQDFKKVKNAKGKESFVHSGNYNMFDLFERCPGLEQRVHVLLDELHDRGARGPVGLDLVVSFDAQGRLMEVKIVEINMRFLGSWRGAMRAHQFARERQKNGQTPSGRYGHYRPYFVGYFELPGQVDVQEVLRRFHIIAPEFDGGERGTWTGAFVTMVNHDVDVTRVHYDVHMDAAEAWGGTPEQAVRAVRNAIEAQLHGEAAKEQAA